MSPKNTPVPIIQTFLVTSAAPLATAEDDFPSAVQLRDTSIETQYMEIKRLTRPVVNNDTAYLTEYDSCTILSSADPSISGDRRQQGNRCGGGDDDDDTISSKSGLIDQDEHVQISQMITTSFIHDADSNRIKRSSSFYDNVMDEEPFHHAYRRPQHYAFDTDIR